MYIKNASVIRTKMYCKYMNNAYREIFVLFSPPFAFVVRGRIKDLTKSYVSYYLSLFTILSGRIQEETKLFASEKGRK